MHLNWRRQGAAAVAVRGERAVEGDQRRPNPGVGVPVTFFSSSSSQVPRWEARDDVRGGNPELYAASSTACSVTTARRRARRLATRSRYSLAPWKARPRSVGLLAEFEIVDHADGGWAGARLVWRSVLRGRPRPLAGFFVDTLTCARDGGEPSRVAR